MAQYKFERFLKFNGDAMYDKVHAAGAEAPRSGIYRCDGCGQETTVLSGQPLPAEGSHEHIPSQKLVRWKLIVSDGGAAAPTPPTAWTTNSKRPQG
jgi:hypothetical protein